MKLSDTFTYRFYLVQPADRVNTKWDCLYDTEELIHQWCRGWS